MSVLMKCARSRRLLGEEAGASVRKNGQGKMNFGQGKVREFHLRLRVGTLQTIKTRIGTNDFVV